ncbi:MAG: hypothetical protein K6D02_01915 [Lachnospiraceae bacterium]|nr:hypothetical protein [Lachnospiraceae bacterium]
MIINIIKKKVIVANVSIPSGFENALLNASKILFGLEANGYKRKSSVTDTAIKVCEACRDCLTDKNEIKHAGVTGKDLEYLKTKHPDFNPDEENIDLNLGRVNILKETVENSVKGEDVIANIFIDEGRCNAGKLSTGEVYEHNFNYLKKKLNPLSLQKVYAEGYARKDAILQEQHRGDVEMI